MNSVKIFTVIGARPQFVKAAAVSKVISNGFSIAGNKIEEVICHTGQHYDENMSGVFFDELNIPKPLHHLNVGSGLHGYQTGQMLEKIESVLIKERPQWVLVYGDTNSTLAGALAAAKLHIPVAHVEAGLRSFNKKMPEEINRVLTDHISNLCLCPTEAAIKNLSNEGITKGVFKVGDVMYDLIKETKKIVLNHEKLSNKFSFSNQKFCLSTIHRPSNTDEKSSLESIFSAFKEIDIKIILPVHPRLKDRIKHFGLGDKIPKNIVFVEPLSYFEMVYLMCKANVIITDSGGVQKEAFMLGVPCLTLRDETEWVETLSCGMNVLVGNDKEKILKCFNDFKIKSTSNYESHPDLYYGNGRASEKIIQHILES